MELLNNVWNADINIENVTIDRNIKRIRDAFKREAKGDQIRTVRRIGYVFNDQFEQSPSLPQKGRLTNAGHLNHCLPSGRRRD
jgi:DNA-binding winged helix-turn-helix (wHTH) protein